MFWVLTYIMSVDNGTMTIEDFIGIYPKLESMEGYFERHDGQNYIARQYNDKLEECSKVYGKEEFRKRV